MAQKNYKVNKKDDFFEKISEGVNYMDTEVVKQVYYEMIRVMSRELRKTDEITMPDWGAFKIVEHKARRMRSVADGQMIMMPARKTIKFVGDYKLKRFFALLDK